MDIQAITKDVILSYIRKIAKERKVTEVDIQLVLNLKSEKEVGVFLLEKYTTIEDYKVNLKKVLGITYSMFYMVVNGFICKSLCVNAYEAGIDFSRINCMIYATGNDDVKLCLYKGQERLKNITFNELLRE